MRKKLLTLVTVFALVLSLCPTALAADKDYYDEDQPHADVDFEDMEYVHMTMEEIQAEVDAITPLIDDAANEAEVSEKFDAFAETLDKLRTMATLANIATSSDVYDEEAEAEYAYVTELYSKAFDALNALMRDILNSPCTAFLETKLLGAGYTEEDIEELKSYEEMTEEELERINRETALEADYYKAYYAEYPVEVAEGVTMTVDEAVANVEAALAAYYIYPTEETYDAYLQAYDQYALAYEGNLKAINAATGDIYLELVELRNEMAQAEGYDNYADYAYEEIYIRDYTPAEIKTFEDAVKENIPEINDALTYLVQMDSDSPVHSVDYSGDVAFEMMRPYVGKIAAEVQESFDYMMDHHLHDYGYGEGTKDGSGFTTYLPTYGAPYTFNSPTGSLYDFSTAVHEFGHYNRYYWTPNGLFDYADDIDQAEVHSQGMELMFTQFYDDIFGDESQVVLNYLMSNLTSALVSGCLEDEFQQFAYTTEDLTVEKLNDEYFRLNVEYGQTPAEDDGHGYYTYTWFAIHHTFDQPMYYISYATSAAGAFSFWLDAQENGYEEATDAYMTYASLPADMGLREGLAEAGVDDPLTETYVSELADALWEKLDIDAQMEALYLPPYLDVPDGAWYAEAINILANAGAVTGYGDRTFGPADPVTWDVILDTLELEVKEGDIDPTAPITRLEFAKLMAGYLQLEPDGTALSPFADTTDSSVAALSALGLINGVGGGLFEPDRDLTRAEFCAICYRSIQYLAALAAEQPAA